LTCKDETNADASSAITVGNIIFDDAADTRG
jgi:hypothetical protein